MKRLQFAFYFASCAVSLAQGFTNLDFDSPDLGALSEDPGVPILRFGEPSKLVPGWSITVLGKPVDRVWYNGDSLAGVFPATLLRDFKGGYQISPNPNHLVNSQLKIDPVSLTQIGVVPSGTTDLVFYSSLGETSTDAFINGTKVSYDQISPSWFSLNLRGVAGKEAELKFTFRQLTEFDSIGFIPEPSVLHMGLIGVSCFLIRKFVRR